jgi:hypothetical protein
MSGSPDGRCARRDSWVSNRESCVYPYILYGCWPAYVSRGLQSIIVKGTVFASAPYPHSTLHRYWLRPYKQGGTVILSPTLVFCSAKHPLQGSVVVQSLVTSLCPACGVSCAGQSSWVTVRSRHSEPVVVLLRGNKPSRCTCRSPGLSPGGRYVRAVRVPLVNTGPRSVWSLSLEREFRSLGRHQRVAPR